MKTRIHGLITLLVAIATSTVLLCAYSPAPASAYLHVENAKDRCVDSMGFYFNNWSAANYGPGSIWVRVKGVYAQRIGDNQVIVDCGFEGNQGWATRGQKPSQGEVRAYMIGDDATAAPYFGGGYPAWLYLGYAPFCGGPLWCEQVPGF